MRGHIRKRGNRWVAVVDVGRDEAGRRHQKWYSGFASKREAQRKLTEVLGTIEHDTYAEPSKATVAEYLNEWIDGRDLRSSTLASYRYLIRRHIVPAFGATPLQKLAPERLAAFYRDLQARGLSSRTAQYCHTVVRK